jgi:prenyltransferase beta subunit
MKALLRKEYHKLRMKIYRLKMERHLINTLKKPKPFHYDQFKERVLNFLKSLKCGEKNYLYKYSELSTEPTLYSSAYALMTLSLLDETKYFTESDRDEWTLYFDSFQRHDGLFYDATVANEHYDDSDWWGARHLALHMISAYTDLNRKPAQPFHFLKKYYDLNFLDQWFSENQHCFEGSMDNDFDNKVMNISCLLQYQRDTWRDDIAGQALKHIQNKLIQKINPETGMWGDSIVSNKDILSRKVQFAYHLFPMFFYDGITPFDKDRVFKNVMATQNRFGGFGVPANSSACEDIDSIDILIRVSRPENNKALKESFQRTLEWNLQNQMPDGGFVFRLNEPFVYGHQQLSSAKNMGSIFPTWFRTLSIAYLCRFLTIDNGFKITRCPGYEF